MMKRRSFLGSLLSPLWLKVRPLVARVAPWVSAVAASKPAVAAALSPILRVRMAFTFDTDGKPALPRVQGYCLTPGAPEGFLWRDLTQDEVRSLGLHVGRNVSGPPGANLLVDRDLYPYA